MNNNKIQYGKQSNKISDQVLTLLTEDLKKRIGINHTKKTYICINQFRRLKKRIPKK